MTVDLADRDRRKALLAVALLAPLAASALLAQFRDSVTTAAAVLLLVLVVVAVAAAGDRAAGIVAALSSAAWFDFFLTQPYNTFTITERDDVEVAVLLLLIGTAITEIALWGRRQQARASRREGYLDGVLRVAALASERQTSPDALITHVAQEIVEVLDVDAGRFVRGTVLDPSVPILGHDGQVTRGSRQVDVVREGLPTDDEIALEVRHAGVTVGYFMLTASARVVRPSIEQRKVAILLADQVGVDPKAAPSD